ncbi:unnamed protein product [Heterobilharzia americana]|nr:unnamed protein product [Heterobilharzia americana]
MRELRLDVIDSCHQRIIGRGRLDRIDRLTSTTPIDAILPVINEVGEKLGDLNLSIMIEPVLSSNPKPIITRFNWKTPEENNTSHDVHNDESATDEKLKDPNRPQKELSFDSSNQTEQESSVQPQQDDNNVEHAVDLDIGSLDQNHFSHKMNILENLNNYRQYPTRNHCTRLNINNDNLLNKRNTVNFEDDELISVALEKSKHLREALSCSSLYTRPDDDNGVNMPKGSQSVFDNNRRSLKSSLSNRLIHHSSPDLRSVLFEENNCIEDVNSDNESNHHHGYCHIIDNETLNDPFINNIHHHHHRYHHQQQQHTDNGYDKGEDYRSCNIQENCSVSKKIQTPCLNSEYIKEDDELIENYCIIKKLFFHLYRWMIDSISTCKEFNFLPHMRLKGEGISMTMKQYSSKQHHNTVSNCSTYNNITITELLLDTFLYKQSLNCDYFVQKIKFSCKHQDSINENEQLNAKKFSVINNSQLSKRNFSTEETMRQKCHSNSPRSGCTLMAVKLHFKCLRLFKTFAKDLLSNIKSSSKMINSSKLPHYGGDGGGGGGGGGGSRLSRYQMKQSHKLQRPTSISPTLPFIKTKSSEIKTSADSIHMELEISVPISFETKTSQVQSSCFAATDGGSSSCSGSGGGGKWTTTSFTLNSEVINQFEIKSNKQTDDYINFYCSTYQKNDQINYTNKNNHNNSYIFVNLNNTNCNDTTDNTDHHIRIRLFCLNNPIEENDDVTQWESELIGVNFVNPDEIRSIILSKSHLNSANPTTGLFIHLCSGQKSKTGTPNVIGRLEFQLEPIWGIISMNKTNSDQKNIERTHKVTTNDNLHSIKNSTGSKQDFVMNMFSTSILNTDHTVLDTILCISEGKQLKIPNNYHSKKLLTSKCIAKLQDDSNVVVEHSYLVVRLPWCHSGIEQSPIDNKIQSRLDQFHSNVTWLSGSCPQYAFNIRSQCSLNKESFLRLIKSSIVLEVWSKSMSGSPDHLIGLVKIPTDIIVKLYAHFDLNCSQVYWHSNSVIQSLLKANHPMIPIDSWLSIIDPFSGFECGQLHVLLAAGTHEQINIFLSSRNLKCSIDNTYTTLNQHTEKMSNLIKDIDYHSSVDFTVEHRIGITIEQLREFDPHIPLQHDPNYDGAVPWGDLDCFVQYFFPVDTEAKCLVSYRTSVQMLNKPSNNNNQGEKQYTSCEFISNYSSNECGQLSPRLMKSSSYWNHIHKLCMNTRITPSGKWNEDHMEDLMKKKIETDFIQWILDMLTRADFKSNKLNLKRGLLIEIWLRIYSPNLHDCLAARGYISEELLYSLVNQDRSMNSRENANNDEHKHQSIRFSIDLYDVNSNVGCLNGKLQISLDYCYNIINQSVEFDKTKRKLHSTNKQIELLSTPSKHLSNTVLILPSKTQFNHRIQIYLDGISGLKSSMVVKNHFNSCKNFSFHIRVHCLLIIPSSSYTVNNSYSGDPCYHLHVIKSVISSPVYNSFHAMELNCKLDVQLPSSWLIAYQHYHHNQSITVNNTSNNFELSLIEAILNGDELQMEQYSSPITKPCIMIQVDVWSQKYTTESFHECSQSQVNFWGLYYSDFEKYDESTSSALNPGKEYQLINSSRIPLSGVLFSSRGVITPRWYPLCSFLNRSGDSYSTLPWESKFSGAVQLSMNLMDPKMIKLIPYNTSVTTSMANNIHNSSAIRCLREWNISFSVEKLENGQASVIAFKNELDYWRDSSDENGYQYKHFTIYLNFAHLPKIKELIKDTTELDGVFHQSYTVDDHFKAYAFVRFQFPNYGTQMSQLVYLPNSDQSDNNRSTIVEFKEYKEFIIPISSELHHFLSETALEFQVWIIWTDDKLKGLEDNRSGIRAENFINDGFTTREYSTVHQVPAPRHLGTAVIPLYHLLYPRPKFTSDTIDIQSNIILLCLPVYPLYRSNSSHFYDSWISVQIEMTGSRTENCLMSKRYHMCKMNKLIIPEINGQLGWNLRSCRILPVTNDTILSGNIDKKYELHNDAYTSGLSTDKLNTNKTFPAEIIIEKAYHLRLPHHSNLMNSTESSEKSEPYFKTDDSLNDKKSSYSVFVTFPVDGSNCNRSLINKPTTTTTTTTTTNIIGFDAESMWKQISKCSMNSNTCRIAVTPKVKNLEYANWNYCRFVHISMDLIKSSCTQGLMFHVWTVKDDLDNEDNHIPRLIDCNTGCPSGQILIGVKPLLSTGEAEFSSSISHDSHNFKTKLYENYSVFQNDFSSIPLYSDFSKSTHSLPDCHIINHDKLSINNEEACQSDLNRSVLFENLRTRLNELDEMNNRFKNRLNNLTNSNEKFFNSSENLHNKLLFQHQSEINKSQGIEIQEKNQMNSENKSSFFRLISDKESNEVTIDGLSCDCNYLNLHLHNNEIQEKKIITNTENDYLIKKLKNQSNNLNISECISLDCNSENVDVIDSRQWKKYTLYKDNQNMEKSDNNEMETSNITPDDSDNNENDEHSDISIVSPLPDHICSDIFDIHYQSDGFIDKNEDVQLNNNFSEISREMNFHSEIKEEREEENMNKSYTLSQDNTKSDNHRTEEHLETPKRVYTEGNSNIVEVDDQEVISETAASSVWLPDDDDVVDDIPGVLHQGNDEDHSCTTRSTLTLSPPPLDTQSIRQAEVSLTSSHVLQSIQLNKTIILSGDEFINDKVIPKLTFESNKENKDQEDYTEVEQEKTADETLGSLKTNKDEDISETSRWDENPTRTDKEISTDIQQLLLIPNFFSATPRIEELFTNRSNDLQVDKYSTDLNHADNVNKNVDPLRSRLNARLSEAVHTINTTASFKDKQQTTNSTNMLITDTISALITNGYKTRSLKKAERIFNMTLK